jgi:hypothetical protein
MFKAQLLKDINFKEKVTQKFVGGFRNQVFFLLSESVKLCWMGGGVRGIAALTHSPPQQQWVSGISKRSMNVTSPSNYASRRVSGFAAK